MSVFTMYTLLHSSPTSAKLPRTCLRSRLLLLAAGRCGIGAYAKLLLLLLLLKLQHLLLLWWCGWWRNVSLDQPRQRAPRHESGGGDRCAGRCLQHHRVLRYMDSDRLVPLTGRRNYTAGRHGGGAADGGPRQVDTLLWDHVIHSIGAGRPCCCCCRAHLRL
jgi:hypothetical protein